MTAIRVVVVHASASARTRLSSTLQAEGATVVVGQASGAADAIDAVRATTPDVVVLGLGMPEGGAQVIEELMATDPVPILVLSPSRAGRDSDEAVAALMAGAVDVLPQPAVQDAAAGAALRARVRIVAGVAVVRRTRRRPSVARRPAKAAARRVPARQSIVAIGASTGGPAALAVVLAGLGGVDAAVLVVQHLHADFVNGLVSWMDRVSPLTVERAEDGAELRAGSVYIAPSGVHLRVGKDDVVVLDPLPESLHRPSVDVLFSSLAERASGRTIGVLLTGMGEDGAAGMLALRRRGAVTIAQDETTSVVFGMPRAAQRLGAAAHVLPLDEIAPAIVRAL
ncbi:MAG TPA: chemotaxis protein CheB [Acidimicrobiales bacterium]